MSRAIGVISLSVLITLVVTNIQARRYAIDHAHSSQECKHYSHNLPEPKLIYWFRGTLADANAYWTAIASLVDCKKRLVFSGYVVYHSMAEGAYYRRYFTAIWNADRHKPGQGNFSVYRKPGYNYEVRLTEKEATADLPPVPDAVVNA